MVKQAAAEAAIDGLQGYDFDGYKMNVEVSLMIDSFLLARGLRHRLRCPTVCSCVCISFPEQIS